MSKKTAKASKKSTKVTAKKVAPKKKSTKPVVSESAPKVETPKVKSPKAEKPSALNIAAQILAETGKPMNAKEMIEQMLAKGLWKTEGKTPAATLYSAIFMEIKKKGTASRFRKAEKGKFELNK